MSNHFSLHLPSTRTAGKPPDQSVQPGPSGDVTGPVGGDRIRRDHGRPWVALAAWVAVAAAFVARIRGASGFSFSVNPHGATGRMEQHQPPEES